MKLMKVMFATAIALVFTSAYAFHSGGVAECEGCHAMHSPAPNGVYLLVGNDQSSTCLSCHAYQEANGSSYHVMSLNQTIPNERTPGGDFAWLLKNYTWTGGSEAGQVHGHNVVAVDRGLAADTTNTTAPGGSFPASELACNSCHDPHGKYRRLPNGTIATTGAPIKASGSYPGNEPTTTEAVGVYRLLAGNGYTKGGVTFQGVPAAKVPSSYNQSEAVSQVRVAYGVATTGGHETWGQWCGTCHPDMHSNAGQNYVHPIDQALGTTIAGLYNSYVKSGDLTGTATASFLSLTPFTENTADYTVLASHASNANAYLNGPSDQDQVNCMSCHRAHASGFAEMLRFDNGYEFTVKDGTYVGTDAPAYPTWGSRAPVQARGRTMADWQMAYYGRPATAFATFQRVLCNKCHAKD